MAWQVFVSHAITGFTDRSGRDWALSSYVEMAVRTASARAQNASHLARMRAIGIEYFTIPTSPHPCPLCFPWQGRVITDGPIENPTIPVAATIEQAIAAGLFHPNRAHTLIPVYPGITRLEPGVWTEELQREYTLSQRQRAIERDIRKAKRQLEYAIDVDTRQAALLKVRRRQATMWAFINDTWFARQSRREQVNLADDRSPGPVSGRPPGGNGPTPPHRPFGSSPADSPREPQEAIDIQISERTILGKQVRAARRAIAKVHTVPDSARPVKVVPGPAKMDELGKYSPMRALIEIKARGRQCSSPQCTRWATT